MFYGIDMAFRGWDLFCSRACSEKTHPNETATFFPSVRDYYEALDPHGLGFSSPCMDGKWCFNCGAIIVPKPTVPNQEPTMPGPRLYKDIEDFESSMNTALKVMEIKDLSVPPVEDDRPDMKALMTIFIMATIPMDPKAIAKVVFDTPSQSLMSVRMALLAAYNLGRKRGP